MWLQVPGRCSNPEPAVTLGFRLGETSPRLNFSSLVKVDCTLAERSSEAP